MGFDVISYNLIKKLLSMAVTSNKKRKIFVQPDEPTPENVGDIWIQTQS